MHQQKPQGGAWSGAVRIAGASAEPNTQPQVVYDSQGSLHVLWDCQDCGGQAYHAERSSDGRWTAPMALPTMPTSLDNRSIAAASDSQDTLHALWYEGVYDNSGQDTLQLVYSRRPLQGVWSQPVVLAASRGTAVLREWPSLLSAPSDQLYFLWGVRAAGAGSAATGGDVHLRRSGDGGVSWSDSERISALAGFLSDPAPAVAVDAQGRLAAAWNNLGGTQSVGTYYSESTDGGNAWLQPVRIGPEILAEAIALDAAHGFLYVGGAGVIGESPELNERPGDSGLRQRVTIPAGMHRPTLSVSYQLHRTPNSGGDRVELRVDGDSIWAADSPSSSWTHAFVDVDRWRGLTVDVSLNLHNEHDGNRCAANFDDLSLGSWLAPVVRSVSPSRAEAGESVSLTVLGENLLPGAVRLNDTLLSDVLALNEQSLQVTLPPTLAPNVYDVWVVNAGGQEGVLPAGFSVGWQIYLPVLCRP